MADTTSSIQSALQINGRDEVTTRSPEETLQAMFDGVAEGVLEATDEEILAESRERGRDPLEEAEEVRRLLLDALKAVAPEAEPRPR
jgi:hypothetical protein